LNTKEKFLFICDNHALDELIHNCSGNVDFATMGGNMWWNIIAENAGWKLQQNKLTNHVRILNPSNIRKAWTSKQTMIDTMDLVISKIRSQQYVTDKKDDPLIARMQKLSLLLEKGLITKSEYDAKKQAMLDEI
jgi:hypothetical protein|tara:strand:- start:2396 stop:2797 length:402 start_codon:yes stop_codon:yes gene_type:complete